MRHADSIAAFFVAGGGEADVGGELAGGVGGGRLVTTLSTSVLSLGPAQKRSSYLATSLEVLASKVSLAVCVATSQTPLIVTPSGYFPERGSGRGDCRRWGALWGTWLVEHPSVA